MQITLNNPWNKLPLVGSGQNYVLPQDKPYIDAFNEHSSNPSHQIITNRIPEPRLGPTNAPLLVLQLNPSLDSDQPDIGQLEVAHQSLCNDSSDHLCIANGNKWWMRRYVELINSIGKENLAKKLCSVEYFPYPSSEFNHSQLRLPSQEYTFNIVREAIKRKAIIIVTRGLKIWLGAVPELSGEIGKTVFVTNNPRTPAISPKNLPADVYEKIVKAINA